MAKADALQAFILSWAMILIAIALYYHVSVKPGLSRSGNPVVRAPIRYLEAFVDNDDSTGLFTPADAAIADLRKPYALLDGVLPTSEPGAAGSAPTAAACYDADFQKRLEMTGNYRQLTNNYKRGTPDSCSAPLHDLVLNFYKVDPLPFSGCLKK